MTYEILVYSYSSCSTCRKALNWLNENKIEYELINIIDEPPSKQKLENALKILGDRKLLFSTSGKSYREIGAKVISQMSDDEALNALACDGKLIKRPFVLSPSGDVLVGFKPEKWSETFLE